MPLNINQAKPNLIWNSTAVAHVSESVQINQSLYMFCVIDPDLYNIDKMIICLSNFKTLLSKY